MQTFLSPNNALFDGFGGLVANGGDVNGDGMTDYLVGNAISNKGGKNTGEVFLYSGRTGFLLHRFQGETRDDLFGQSLCALGDVNDDGFDDFEVGAPAHDEPGGTWVGGAYIYGGDDLFLEIKPDATTHSLTLITRGAMPGARNWLMLTDPSGQIPGMAMAGVFGPQGACKAVIDFPPAYWGVAVTVRSVAWDPRNDLFGRSSAWMDTAAFTVTVP